MGEEGGDEETGSKYKNESENEDEDYSSILTLFQRQMYAVSKIYLSCPLRWSQIMFFKDWSTTSNSVTPTSATRDNSKTIVSVLILERLGEKIPLGVPLESIKCVLVCCVLVQAV